MKRSPVYIDCQYFRFYIHPTSTTKQKRYYQAQKRLHYKPNRKCSESKLINKNLPFE